MPYILPYVAPAIQTSNCLFGYFWNICNYNPANAPIFFSLGDAVAAFGLIFAVYQLRKDSWETVLRIREWWQRNLIWYMGGAGLLFIGFATFLRQLPPIFLPAPFNYPILYEFLGFMSFIGAPISLFVSGRRKSKLFNKRRARRFYGVLLNEIARSKNDGIEICVNIIGANIKEITRALRDISWRRRLGKDDSPLTKDEVYASYAEAVTSVILSDDKVARYIATTRLDFLLDFLSELKKNKISLDHTRFGLEKIMESLFREKSSYFYSQLDYRGMTLAANIFEIIFSDPYFVTHFSIFNSAYRFTSFQQLNEEYLTVYLKALEYSLQGFWKNKCPDDMGEEICRAIRNINDYSQSLAYMTHQKDKRKEALSRLQKIEFFLGHTYIWAYRHALEKNLISDYEKEATKRGNYITSVNYAYADCLYHFIESLAIAREEYDGEIRLIAITATTELIGVTARSGGDVAKIQDALIALIWDKIKGDKSMSNERGYFPTVLRVYSEMVGFDVGDGTSVAAQEREKLIKFLYESIKPKIMNGDLMANKKDTFEGAVLPKNIVLNRTTGNFEYIMSGGDRQIMEQPVKPVVALMKLV